jgi:phospholipid/cholesterol/gamma-HCH transport system substrate-binding protein
MKISREVLVGLIFVAAIALLVWGISFLQGFNLFSNERILIGVYSDVNGLIKTNPVYINGVAVGQVKNIYFHPSGSSRVVVEMSIDNDIPIPVNSIARIFSSDLMGSKAIDIRLGDATKMAQNRDTLKPETELSLKDEVNRQVMPLKLKAEDLIMSLDSAVTVVRYIFNRANQENLNQSFVSIKHAFDYIESTTGNLDTIIDSQKGRIVRILANIESISANLQQNQDELSNIFTNLSALSDTLAKAKVAQTLQSTSVVITKIESILRKVEAGKGSLGLLVNDDSLYIQVEKSARDLNLLLEDIKKNPKRYLRFSVF